MSEPLDLKRTLDALDQLRSGILSATTRAEQLERDLHQTLARIDRQFDHDVAGLQEELDDAVTEAESGYQNDRKRLETRHDRRRARLIEAHRNLKDLQLRTVASDEAREVFHLQRDLLQTTRDQDAGRVQADDTLAAAQGEVGSERDALDTLHRGAWDAFRGYPSFRRLLSRPTDTAGLEAADLPGLLQQSRELRAKTEKCLARLRWSPLPRLFSLLPLWLLALFLAVASAGAVPLCRSAGLYPLTWWQAAVAFFASVAVAGGLHLLGGRLSRNAAREIAAAIARGYLLLDAATRAAEIRHQDEHRRLSAETERRTTALQQRWQKATQQAESRREQLRLRLDARLSRTSEHNDRHYRETLAQLDQAHAQYVARLRETTASKRTQAGLQRASRQLEIERQSEAAWHALQADWKTLTESAFATFAAASETARRLFPPWTSPDWDHWIPPVEFLPAAPFARLDADLSLLAGTLPRDRRLVLPGPVRLTLPLLLTFPDQGSILFETGDNAREAALGALNNLVLRLLAAAPPGRARFTIFDPVGLGQSFAGLMHLTDHEDRLINRRIWTQPDHLEQRLAELNDHVEKVTQLYLRNEYATIAEYNEQAGRIAEPYQFLVVADFPTNFSDVAARRLLSLAASGPRCGLFTLIHWDRRKAGPSEFVPDDLRRNSVLVRHEGGSFELANRTLPGTQLTLEAAPDPDRTTAFLQRVGRSSIDSNRVEMPFVHAAPDDQAFWSLETTNELRIPIGRTGATKLQYLALGRGTRQHALIAGKTGSGKSTLFHVLITNLALWCSPDQVEFYLVDFKKGVEFKCYAVHRLPHARVVAIESDREFGLSVLQRVDAELQRRGDLFREVGAQDLPGYKRVGGTATLPRTLLIIDEFQELFTEDDRIAQNAALLLDRLVRQGRAFGIHILLGSQTLGGAYTLARSTLGQMVIRIALQCNEADALLIMDDDNTAPRLLSRPGEAIYNDAAGAIEGNSPFQIVWLPDDEREQWLTQVRRRADLAAFARTAPVVFEGNSPAEVLDNSALTDLLEAASPQPVGAPHLWLGAPNSIKGPTEIVLHRQNGNNLLILGQYDDSSLALLGIGLVALAAQHPSGTAEFVLLDATAPDSPHRAFLERLVRAIPHPVALVGHAQLRETLDRLAGEVERRTDAHQATAAPTVYLVIHHLERFKALRYEDDFGINLRGGEAKPDPGQQLNRILSDGTHLGVHVLCVCDTYNNATRFLSRRALAEFELRVLFQMNASDSASLIDSPKASTLGLYRALLHNAREGTLETFRPYALPDPVWLDQAAHHLARLLFKT